MNRLCHALLPIALTLIWSASSLLHAQTYQVIHHFAEFVDGSHPSGLTRDNAGNFFGTTYEGGPSGTLGTVFKMDSSHAVTVLHTFAGPPDGANPLARVTLDSAGNLYGTTQTGGINHFGTVFKIAPTGAETILHSFNQLNGEFPSAALTRDPAGNMYSTTFEGGLYGGGVVFRINTFGTGRTLYQFAGADGFWSVGGLARDSKGNLYGTTFAGGTYNAGSVYKLARNGTETVLHSFTGGVDGGSPGAEPVLDSAGNLYSTTTFGGDFGLGTVFKVDRTGNFSVVHSFGGADGDGPIAGLVLDSAGNLYGNTIRGGDFNLGVVFKIDPFGNETVLHSFAGGADGARPISTLLLSPDGTIFGSTQEGGFHQSGTLFRLKPS